MHAHAAYRLKSSGPGESQRVSTYPECRLSSTPSRSFASVSGHDWRRRVLSRTARSRTSWALRRHGSPSCLPGVEHKSSRPTLLSRSCRCGGGRSERASWSTWRCRSWPLTAPASVSRYDSGGTCTPGSSPTSRVRSSGSPVSTTEGRELSAVAATKASTAWHESSLFLPSRCPARV